MRILTLITCLCLLTFGLQAQTAAQETRGAQVSQSRFLGKTTPLRDKQPVQVPNNQVKRKAKKKNFPRAPLNFKDNVPMENINDNAFPRGEDPARQMSFGNADRAAIPVEPDLVIEGIDVDEANGIGVPDTNGDVGPDHYIQITNGGGSVFKIFNKEGDLMFGPSSANVFWEDFNISGFGDPVVLYDQGADRWVLTEFGDFSTSVMLVAVSVTSDPMGEWNAYEFQAPSFPDYPKYGIWNDAYYITTNEGGDPNIPIYVLDRDAMLNGEPTAAMQRVGVPKFPAANAFAFQVATPVDWDGAQSPPPAGSPAMVVRLYDDAWDGGVDKLEIWEIDVDWDNPDNTTVTGPIELPTEPFDSDVCALSIYECIEQSNGSLVSALMQVVMHRVNYRNFGTHESIVLNHVVDVDGNNFAGVRWYELRKPNGGEWGIHQQGTVSPDDNHRFMGSIAMDAFGNIGLAYSVMGPDDFLSLRYTGRTPADPLGEMSIDEYEFATGLSYHVGNRWGDYAAMAVDETNGSSFWFTSEYMKESNDWGTKIVSFQVRRDTFDMGPFSVIAPQNSAELTDAETVTVNLRNYGIESISDFQVGLMLDGALVATDNVMETILPGNTYQHTFSNTVDLSVVNQEYELTIFTFQQDDTNEFNDTLRTPVIKLPRYDASITSFANISDAICATELEVGIVVTNLGQNNLTSTTVTWSFNGGADQIIEWTGDLAFGESDTIYVLLENLIDGENTIAAATSMPNNEVDEGPENDALSRTFQGITDGSSVKLQLLTDNYPNETTWEVRNESGQVLFTGGPYSDDQTLYEEEWCMGPGCYTFVINDSYGDGISFGGVEGSYTIVDGDGNILAGIINPNFGTIEINDFCNPYQCLTTANLNVINESEAGANNGAIFIDASNGVGPFQYSIDGGQTFVDNPSFLNLIGGEYELLVQDALGCTYEETVLVGTCAVAADVNVTDASADGAADGSLTVVPTSGVAPFEYSLNGNPFQDSPDFDGLVQGEYVIFVRDALGCFYDLEVFVGPCLLQIETVIGNETSPGANDGAIQINIVNGFGPYLYSIDGGQNFIFNSIFLNLPAGVYDVVVTDDVGCSVEIEVELTTCTLQTTVSTTGASTQSASDGSITVNVSDGEDPYEFSIDNGVTYQTSGTFDNLPPGEYSVLIRDGDGCTTSVTVTVSVMVSVNDLIREGQIEVLPNPSDGVFRINVSGLDDRQLMPVEIYNAAGKLIQRSRLIRYDDVLTAELSLIVFPAGSYYVRLKDKDFDRVVKVIRN